MILSNNCSSSMDKGKAIGGNATDRAALEFISSFKESGSRPKIMKRNFIPFSSDTKFMATSVTGDYDITYIKGAPEKIIPFCTSYYTDSGEVSFGISKARIDELIKQLAGQAVRIIALATSESEVSASALAIARGGILTGKSDDLAITSDELKLMSDQEVSDKLGRIKVVARALPSDKSRLVRIAQAKGLVVGMTGDGVNDAPALKQADIGFAMGSGTEIAKEAGDIVILDDNFSSIAKAICYGRTIFKSIRKFIIYQMNVMDQYSNGYLGRPCFQRRNSEEKIYGGAAQVT
ncbi:cation transporting atpase [Holotrichia oblita]|nr:cation transporting atpase [Holotrichia oblita]